MVRFGSSLAPRVPIRKSKQLWHLSLGGERVDFRGQLFSSGDFQPHGFCYPWNSRLVWLHLVSDGLIALAYCEIKTDVPVTFATGYSADIAALQRAQ
jgi:hypothetical protein